MASPTVPLWIRLICSFVKIVSYVSRRSDGTLNRRLGSWLAKNVPATLIPTHGVYTKDVLIDNATGVWVRIFIPVQEDITDEEFPIVFYFHGGGFCEYSAANVSYDMFCRRLAGTRRVVVISVEYRLAPEHKYPTAYQDCFSALTWLPERGLTHLPSNVNFSRCFLMGDSAGGNIVHHVGCLSTDINHSIKISLKDF